MKKSLLFLMAALLVVGLLAGCTPQEEKVKITVSEVTHSVFYAPQYAAIALGYFEDEGLDVELINGEGADKVMTAVVAGQVDIGLAGPEAAIYVYNEGKEDYAKVFAQLTKRDGSFIMGRTQDDDFSFADLKGKHLLGGRKGGVPYMTLEYVLKNNGVQPSDLNLDTSIQFANMAGAFAGGTGDYVTLFEPTASLFEQEGKGYVLASVGQESGEIPYTAYFANSSYIEKNPEVIQKFTNAIARAQQWITTATPKEIAQTIADFFPDTDLEILEKVAKRYQEIDAWNETPFMTEDAFNRLQDVMEEAGELTQRADYSKLVDNSYATRAADNLKK